MATEERNEQAIRLRGGTYGLVSADILVSASLPRTLAPSTHEVSADSVFAPRRSFFYCFRLQVLSLLTVLRLEH